MMMMNLVLQRRHRIKMPSVSVLTPSIPMYLQLFLNLLALNMNILWLFLINAVYASLQPGFGTSYLKNSKLCKQWSCVNTKLGLPDSLPTTEHFTSVLRSLLPTEWKSVVETVVNTCYNDRPRRYSNTCPGQAILHCAVDQLIVNCPEIHQRKEDACAPVNSLAGVRNMFTQSRYENAETNMAVDRRPVWFLKNYFNQKCCDVPPLFNSTTLSECGFTNIMQYFMHHPSRPNQSVLLPQRGFDTTTPATGNGDSLKVVGLNEFVPGNTPLTTDPLDCCDISDFIQPSCRQECNFELSWGGQSRLVVKNEPVTTTSTERPSTRAPITRRDITLVPQSCEKETCVFSKLNIMTNGTVDLDAFTRLLDNLTTNHPSWTKGKGRVLTTCISKPITEYEGQCEINKILSCTFDVLTENCPNTSKNDPCKHSTSERTCQISSSKYRPKHRREICPLPELVDHSILSECGITSISRTEPVSTVIKPKTYKLSASSNKCKDLTPSTTCLLSKMGVLNKYGFLDYFKMKDRIRNYTADKAPTLEAVYTNAFNMELLYSEHCNSPKKLLNLLDSMLMTCPKLKSRNTAQCSFIFDQINNSPIKKSVPQEYAQRILDHFLHVYNASAYHPQAYIPRHYRKIKKTPIYHYGFLNDKQAPKVVTINIPPKLQPVSTTPLVVKPPLVLLPVYMRVPHSNLMIRGPYFPNGIWRSSINKYPTNNVHINSVPGVSTSTISTTELDSTIQTESVSTTERISTTHRISTSAPHFSTRFVTAKSEKFEMLKPE